MLAIEILLKMVDVVDGNEVMRGMVMSVIVVMGAGVDVA